MGLSELGRSTGAPVIRAVAGLGIPIELSGGGPRSRHSLPGSSGVTPTAALSAVRATGNERQLVLRHVHPCSAA